MCIVLDFVIISSYPVVDFCCCTDWLDFSPACVCVCSSLLDFRPPPGKNRTNFKSRHSPHDLKRYAQHNHLSLFFFLSRGKKLLPFLVDGKKRPKLDFCVIGKQVFFSFLLYWYHRNIFIHKFSGLAYIECPGFMGSRPKRFASCLFQLASRFFLCVIYFSYFVLYW